MTRIIHRIRTIVVGGVRPPSPSLLDAAFSGVHDAPATPIADHGQAVRAGSRIDRLRSQRRDLAAALHGDAGTSEHELTIWPPAVGRRGACQGC